MYVHTNSWAIIPRVCLAKQSLEGGCKHSKLACEFKINCNVFFPFLKKLDFEYKPKKELTWGYLLINTIFVD